MNTSRKYYYLVLILIIQFISIFNLKSQTKTQTDYILMVQPIVACSDDGTEPASFAIPEHLIDRAYEKANIDFYFLEPIYYNNTKARDGLINLDEICELAEKDGLLKGSGGIVNMFFVNSVDGHKGPLGRGMFGGNITFIALGDKPQPEMEAFVIGHEVAHNLSLPHVVDDPNISDTIPNLLGEGDFSERIDPKYSLTDYQIETVMESPLVHKRVDLLSVEKGRVAILDETFEPFFKNLQLKEIAAFTQTDIFDKSLAEARAFARGYFSNSVIAFNDNEERALIWLVNEVNTILIDNGLSFMAHHPWSFIKVNDSLCGGFARTRGTYIILSEKHLSHLTNKWSENMTEETKSDIIVRMGSLIVHEQLHSIQRTFPSKFEELYHNQWGFQKAIVLNDESLILNQLSNPDAPVANWLVPNPDSDTLFYWVRTLLRESEGIPEMGADFIDKVFEVKLKDGKYYLQTGSDGYPVWFSLNDFTMYKNRFPVTRGLDHPNEISAYMFSDYFIAMYKKSVPFGDVKKEAKHNSESFINWLKDY